MNQREPTPDELLAMAYADGELDAAARAAFEARLEREPALALQVTELKRLELFARHAAPREPMDHEWRRLERDGGQRALWGVGWTLLFGGLLGLAGWSIWCLECSEWPLAPKLLLPLAIAGAFFVLVAAVRARRRTLPYDAYTDVKR